VREGPDSRSFWHEGICNPDPFPRCPHRAAAANSKSIGSISEPKRRRARGRGGAGVGGLFVGLLEDPIGGRAALGAGLIRADLAGAGGLDREPDILLPVWQGLELSEKGVAV
jgi:hypothetical protein